MNETFEYQGYWWLSGADEDKVPGILKFDPDEGASLELMGSLKGLEGIVDPFEPEIILGLSSEGKHVTLKGCGKTRGALRFGGGFSTSAFAVSTVFVGSTSSGRGTSGSRGSSSSTFTWRRGPTSRASNRSSSRRRKGRRGCGWR